MLRSCSRLRAIAVIVAAGLVVAACGSPSSSTSNSSEATSGTTSSVPPTTRYASAQATVIGKSTDVVLNPAISAALEHEGIAITAVAPAAAKTTLLFPVSGGQIVVATLVGTVNHAGGLTFSHGGKSVTLTALVINTNTKQLTATVGGQPMPIFDLNLASLKRGTGRHSAIVASDIKLTVTLQAASSLDSTLGLSTFKAGMKFGIATLTLAFARGHR